MNEPKWYYFNANNETIGPFSKIVLIELSQAGQISNETLVFKEGTEAWQPFGEAFSEPPEPEPLPPEPSPAPVVTSVPKYIAHRKKRDVGYKELTGGLVQMAAVSAVHALDSLNTPERRAADNKKIKGCLIPTVVIFVVLVVIIIINAPTSEEIKKRDAQREEDRLNELAKRDRENEELRKEQNREMMRRYIRAFPNGR